MDEVHKGVDLRAGQAPRRLMLYRHSLEWGRQSAIANDAGDLLRAGEMQRRAMHGALLANSPSLSSDVTEH